MKRKKKDLISVFYLPRFLNFEITCISVSSTFCLLLKTTTFIVMATWFWEITKSPVTPWCCCWICQISQRVLAFITWTFCVRSATLLLKDLVFQWSTQIIVGVFGFSYFRYVFSPSFRETRSQKDMHSKLICFCFYDIFYIFLLFPCRDTKFQFICAMLWRKIVTWYLRLQSACYDSPHETCVTIEALDGSPAFTENLENALYQNLARHSIWKTWDDNTRVLSSCRTLYTTFQSSRWFHLHSKPRIYTDTNANKDSTIGIPSEVTALRIRYKLISHN